MKVIVLIRRSEQYWLGDNIDPGIYSSIPAIAWWDSLFTIPYREMRRRLSAIARQNFDTLKVDAVLNTESQWAIDLVRSQKNCWIVPVDEDDWLPAELPEQLRKTEQSTDIAVWPTTVARAFLYVDRGVFSNGPQTVVRNNEEGIPFSPSYACSPQASSLMIREHCSVQHCSRTLLSGPSSVYVNTPVSRWVMSNMIHCPDDLVRMWTMQRENELDVPDEFKPQAQKLQELFWECSLQSSPF